jgi:hypothetical protein
MSSKTGLGSEDLNQTKRMCMTTYEYALSHVSPELGRAVSLGGWDLLKAWTLVRLKMAETLIKCLHQPNPFSCNSLIGQMSV